MSIGFWIPKNSRSQIGKELMTCLQEGSSKNNTYSKRSAGNQNLPRWLFLLAFPTAHPLRTLTEGMSQLSQRAILGTQPTLLLTSALLYALGRIRNRSLSLSSNSQSNSHDVLRISSLGLEHGVYLRNLPVLTFLACYMLLSSFSLFSLTLFSACIDLFGAATGLLGSYSTSVTLGLALDSLWRTNESLSLLTTKSNLAKCSGKREAQFSSQPKSCIMFQQSLLSTLLPCFLNSV